MSFVWWVEDLQVTVWTQSSPIWVLQRRRCSHVLIMFLWLGWVLTISVVGYGWRRSSREVTIRCTQKTVGHHCFFTIVECDLWWESHIDIYYERLHLCVYQCLAVASDRISDERYLLLDYKHVTFILTLITLLIHHDFVKACSSTGKAFNTEYICNASTEPRTNPPIFLSRAYTFPCSIPHLFRHLGSPLTAPVPTSGIPLPRYAVSRFSLPNPALIMSLGIPHIPLRALSVPLSSLFNALRRRAGSQSTLY